MIISNRKKRFHLKLNKLKIQGNQEDSDKCQEIGNQSPRKKEIFQIEKNLFLSGYQGAKNISLLKSQKISHIINLTAHKCPNIHEGMLQYSSFCFADNEKFDLSKHLEPVLEILRLQISKGETVLVHCQKGISRAPSVVMAFLIKDRGYSYEQALNFVQKKNPKAYPNFGFLTHLQRI